VLEWGDYELDAFMLARADALGITEEDARGALDEFRKKARSAPPKARRRAAWDRVLDSYFKIMSTRRTERESDSGPGRGGPRKAPEIRGRATIEDRASGRYAHLYADSLAASRKGNS
jgi:hypothetical protein